MTRRLMYIESKTQAVGGRGRIGWVEHSSTCQVYRYDGKVFRIGWRGLYNCFDAGSGEYCLVSEPRSSGREKLHGGFVDVDEDARDVYWLQVRERPDCRGLAYFLAEPRR